MSWNIGKRSLKIKSSKNSLKDIVKIVNKVKKNNKNVFSFQVELFDNYGFVNVMESGGYKYGCFSSSERYNFEQFINDIIMSDKENTTIIMEEREYKCTYSYKNNEIVCENEVDDNDATEENINDDDESDDANKIIIHNFIDFECEFNKKINLDYFFDYQDFLNELDEFKFDLKYEVKDNYIYFSEVNISLMEYFRYVIILSRHKKIEGRDLASRLFWIYTYGNENSIPYLKNMTKDYTKEEYKNKIFGLLKDDNSSNANYIKGEILYSINNKDGIDYLINSLNKDDSCKYYLKKPGFKGKVSVNDKVNYRFMDTCIKISDYYVSLNDYDKALEYINKGIDYFPYSYVVYNKKKDIYNKLNLNIKDILKEVKENILLKYLNIDLYKFEDTNNYKEFIDKIKE